MNSDVCPVDSQGFPQCPHPKLKVNLVNRSTRGIKIVAEPDIFPVNGRRMFYEITFNGPMNAFAIEEINVDEGRGDYVAFAPDSVTLINWLANQRGIQGVLSEEEKGKLPFKEATDRLIWEKTKILSQPLPDVITMDLLSQRESVKKELDNLYKI